MLTQEYGRYFGMKIGVFRGGCLTGPQHAASSFTGSCPISSGWPSRGSPTRSIGYKGKQVRDQIHSDDVIRAFEAFYADPRPGEVYNLGGGRDNSASVLELLDRMEQLTGRRIECRTRSGRASATISSTSRTWPSCGPITQAGRSLANLDSIVDDVFQSVRHL